MKAVVVTPKQKGSARLEEAPRPEITPGQALVRVLEVGIDGADREINRGLYGDAPKGSDYLILGHESLGRIEQVGSGVRDLRKGDLVAATVRRPCPENCPNCRHGAYDMCSTGNYRERGIEELYGYMAEYHAEEPRFLVKVPDEVKHVAVLLEPLSIVEKAFSQASASRSA